MNDSLVAVALLGAFSLAFVGSTDAGERHGLDLGILEQLDTRRDSPVIQPSRAGLAALETRKCLDVLLAPATTGTCAYEVVPAAASGDHSLVVAQAQDGASAVDADAGLAGQSAEELAGVDYAWEPTWMT